MQSNQGPRPPATQWPLAARIAMMSVATALPWAAIYLSLRGTLGG